MDAVHNLVTSPFHLTSFTFCGALRDLQETTSIDSGSGIGRGPSLSAKDFINSTFRFNYFSELINFLLVRRNYRKVFNLTS